MPIDEYNKLLEYQKAAKENMVSVIVGYMGDDIIKVVSKDEALNRLGEIIEGQAAQIDQLDKEVDVLRKQPWPLYGRKRPSLWQKLFE